MYIATPMPLITVEPSPMPNRYVIREFSKRLSASFLLIRGPVYSTTLNTFSDGRSCVAAGGMYRGRTNHQAHTVVIF